MEKQHLRYFAYLFEALSVVFLLVWFIFDILPLLQAMMNNTLAGSAMNEFITIFISPYFIILIITLIIAGVFEDLKNKADEPVKQVEKQVEKRVEKRVETRIETQPIREKETIIKERVKVIHTLPEECPSCRAAISQNNVRWIGALQAACPYCNFAIKLIEKEI